MNIYDTAHKLAEEIRKSDECVHLAELRERAYADETNRLLLAAKEMLRPLAARQDAPCTAALSNMMRLTLLVQNTRLDELRVVSACEFGFAAIAQLHGLIERVIHDVGARRDSDV